MRGIWKKIVAAIVALALPAGASAGPIRASLDPVRSGLMEPQPERPIARAVARTGSKIAPAQREIGRSRTRLWTSVALLAGGSALGVLSRVELGDDEAGPDDGEDLNGSDDGEDADGWGSKAMLGGGIAAAALGGVLLMTGGKKRGPAVSVNHGGFAVRHTLRF
ncbi:MAG TPA: hypothetical protein VH740_08225 [Vicinamibacterales bacterium]|jgi:hypothetical protein